jgi:hypothetical protein
MGSDAVGAAHSANWRCTVHKECTWPFVADFDLGAITDKLGRGSTVVNVILEGVDERFVCLHALDIGNKQCSTDKNLDCGCVGVDHVSSNSFITAMDVESRVGGLVPFLEDSAHGHISQRLRKLNSDIFYEVQFWGIFLFSTRYVYADRLPKVLARVQ